MVRPSNIINGSGCKKCANEKRRGAELWTHEQYVKRAYERMPNITVVGVYVDNRTPISHRCNVCGYCWDARPSSILSGHGCRVCGYKGRKAHNRKSHEKYVDELKSVNPNIVVLGKYINAKTPILHQCLLDGYQWNGRPENILYGAGCPLCGKKSYSLKKKKTHNEYIGEVKKINPSIKVIGAYVGVFEPIEHECLVCGNRWSTAPGNILSGRGCPRCRDSHGEKSIRQWLESHKIEYEQQYRFADCRDVKPLPFDFYIPKYNTAIEYDGQQHFMQIFGEQSYEHTKAHDIMKNVYCQNNNIDLLRIPYWDFENIDNILDKTFVDIS